VEINGAGLGTPLQDLEVLAQKEFYGLSIILDEKAPNNTFPWQIDVDARFANGGRARLGSIITIPSSSGPQGQSAGGNFAVRPTGVGRIVAIASAPGAVGWWVRVSAAVGAQAELFLVPGRGYGVVGMFPLTNNGQPLPALPYRSDRNPALATSRVVIPTRTRIWAFKGLRAAGAGTAFFQAFDSTTVPAAGTAADFVEPLAANQTFFHQVPFGPQEVQNGISWALSSTADVFTPTGNAELWVRTYFD